MGKENEEYPRKQVFLFCGNELKKDGYAVLLLFILFN